VGAYAQGLVSLQDAPVVISTNNGTIGAIGSQLAGSYYFEMLFILNTGQAAPTPSFYQGSGLSGWTDSTLSGTNGNPITAKINGEFGTTGIGVPGWASGASAFYVVLGWSANEGTTWASIASVLGGSAWTTLGANGGLFGYSTVGYVTSATSPSPAQLLFGGATGLINTGWDLNPVPEPSVLALAGLGGLSLLLLRRRH